MLLTATNVELPSDDWSLRSFKEYKDESTERAMSFVADFLHKPTGLVVAVGNTGRNDMNDYGVCTVTRKKEVGPETQRDVLQKFDEFCRASLPALEANEEANRNKNSPFGNLYSDRELEIDYIRDGIFDLFYEEWVLTKRFNRASGVIYRVKNTEEGKEFRVLHNKRATVAQYPQGMDAEYWDKSTKTWVAF